MSVVEIYPLFRKCFPYVVRDEETVLRLVGNKENHVIEKRNADGSLIGVSVIHKNTILLLCVEEGCRNQGIGTWLLEQSEQHIKEAGYDEVVIGVGDDYITPGVPTSKKYAPAELERLEEGVNDTGSSFFEKRGYRHSQEDNCFDMKFPLREFDKNEHSVGDVIDGITYRFATKKDLQKITECTDAACQDFTQWYQDDYLYPGAEDAGLQSRVLLALSGEQVVGTLMVEPGEEGGQGSIGCTAVHPDFRGRHIARTMVVLGTKHLKEVGMQEAYLSYTYSGLERMYGYSGYKIFVYFMMARKKI